MEFRIADLNAAYRGVSLDTLMQGAGHEVARRVLGMVKRTHPRVLILAGKGNNGGDGFVAADVMAHAAHVTVVFAEGRASVDSNGPAGRALKAIESHRSIVKVDWGARERQHVMEELRRADVVLDCLLGSGISGPARAPYDELIRLTKSAKGRLISVDVPSGFPFSPAVAPNKTLTIEAPKVGMNRKNSGSIIPVHIGFPPEAWTHTGPGELQLIPPVPDDAHKGDRGVLAVVAGGPYSGAPALAALAAHACGVGLVHIFTPSSVADTVRRFDATLIVHPLDGQELGRNHPGAVSRGLAEHRCDALAIGPGLGRSPATLEAARRLLLETRLPMVVDADAITAAAALKAGALRRAIVTPHAGEFKTFTGRPPGDAADLSARCQAAREAARAHATTVLLKGPTTVITDGERVKLNDAGVSAMAVGGTGDVLTGVVGAMLAKGMTPFDAGRVAAFIAGKAGELAFEDLGHSLKPTDLIAKIPRVLSRYLSWWGGRP